MISRLRSLVTAVALFTALAVMLLWALHVRMQLQLRDQILERGELRSLQLADALGGQVEALFHLLDLGLLDLRGHWHADDAGFEGERRRVFDLLPAGLVSHLTVADGEGHIIYNSLGVERGVSVADREYFQSMQRGSDRLYIGMPVRSRLNDQWLFVLGRPIYRDGAFAGTIHLALSSDYLARLLGRLALTDQDAVALVHPGGRVLARSLDNAAAMRQSVPDGRPYLQSPDKTQGTFRETGAFDQVPRLFGWQRLPGLDAIMVVGLSESMVLAPLEVNRREALILTGLLSLALATVGAVIGALLWRLERGRDELQRNELRLKAAQRTAKVGHWEYEIATRKLTWSDEVYRIFRRSPGEFVPTYESYVAMLHPDDVPDLRVAFDQALAQRTPLDVVHRVVLPDDTVRHVRLLCTMNFEHDQLMGYLGTVQDITELREAEVELQRLNTELERRVRSRTRELVTLNRELESFTYSVSHDLRTPLRSIHGFATVLADQEAERLSDEGRGFLARIQEAASRMGLLINDMLAMAKQSRAQLKVKAVNLSELARSVAADLSRNEPKRSVRWSIADDLWVQADPVLMTVVVQNLLGNAWKYSSQVADAHIELFRTGEEDGQQWFCVRDNGAGFDMQFANQLFQPFKRLHRQEEFEGTGVGLASVLRILQRHGGSVRAEGEVGKGATFCFSLPVEPLRSFADSDREAT